MRSDRRDFRPYGLRGGQPGAPSINLLRSGNDERVLPAKFTMNIKRGDVLRHELAGPGGWGDPLERDPQAVLADLRDEVIGEAAAREVYGVAIDRARWTVAAHETDALRRRLRAERAWREVPAVLQDRPA
jgi:N-methylhydantoinase B